MDELISDADDAQARHFRPRLWLLPTGVRLAMDRPCVATEGKPGTFIVQQTVNQLPADAFVLADDVAAALAARQECVLPRDRKANPRD
ncbi:hypothetical protein [Candidatus Mycobacterium methanotrophicum]|uniref:Uncharacterized protein n=1 Tax=Candidatus Mycobacterium methanotrophicum TaxID=2943498 RepID=A0ABY4QU25_9MYCO|nr:hypothetical protein [Candidatus Mycobacterium methanotrophicum]UQX13458.1 hypothetical protein M5I08_24965 [Candidatus Mycobacterium methanotrophicum]